MRYYIIRIYREGDGPRNAMAGVVEDAAGRQRQFHDTVELLHLLRDGNGVPAHGDAAGISDPVEKP